MTHQKVMEATIEPQYVPDDLRQFGGGGGGGGGDRPGGPRGYDPKGIAAAFRLLASSSAKLFTRQSSFELTEEAVHALLTGSFEALAQAAEQGTLLDLVARMDAAAGAERSKLLNRIGDTAKVTVDETMRIVEEIIKCLGPRLPR